MRSSAFTELVRRQAPYDELSDWFRPTSAPLKIESGHWIDEVAPVANTIAGFDWLDEGERRMIRQDVLHFVHGAFTEAWPEHVIPHKEARQSFEPFLRWLEASPDFIAVAFCWDLLRFARSTTPEIIHWLQDANRFPGGISFADLRLAASLEDEAETMFRWPDERWAVVRWERDHQAYLELLSSASYLVRGTAAKALGCLYYGIVSRNDTAAPPLPEMLRMIQSFEVRISGIAGPFLHGTQWSLADAVWDICVATFDMRTWFLETLRNSERETRSPNNQTLEFYAHEFFATDADAIRELMAMGRPELALMAATEDPSVIDGILPVLLELEQSADSRVAGAIKTYLAEREHHAGLENFPDCD